MLHVPPKSNEFEGDIIPCSDLRLGTSQPCASDFLAFDTPQRLLGSLRSSVRDSLQQRLWEPASDAASRRALW
ncbi:hypothetical protein Tco_0046753 [Tanacetum coccineum]